MNELLSKNLFITLSSFLLDVLGCKSDGSGGMLMILFAIEPALP